MNKTRFFEWVPTHKTKNEEVEIRKRLKATAIYEQCRWSRESVLLRRANDAKSVQNFKNDFVKKQ